MASGSTWVWNRCPACHVPRLTPQSGPLLWHFEENTTSDPSIELDLEEVKILAAHIGFEIKVGISYPPVVSHALHLLFVRTNAQSIRPTSITRIQCSGIYITPHSGRPRKSCSFLRATSTKTQTEAVSYRRRRWHGFTSSARWLT